MIGTSRHPVNTISWSLSSQAQSTTGRSAVDQALKIIEGRINKFGVTEPTLQRQGAQQSASDLLQMPGVEDPERVKNLIGSESHLDLMKVADNSDPRSPVSDKRSGGTGHWRNDPAEPRCLAVHRTRRQPTSRPQPNQTPDKFLDPRNAGDRRRQRTAGRFAVFAGQGSDYKIEFHLKPPGRRPLANGPARTSANIWRSFLTTRSNRRP